MEKNTLHFNHKSDFSIIEMFCDNNGVPMPLPDNLDFKITYATSGNSRFIASRINGVYSNCRPHNGSIIVIFKDHGLPEGKLFRDFSTSWPDSLMPGGYKKVCGIVESNVILWRFPSDNAPAVCPEITLHPGCLSSPGGPKSLHTPANVIAGRLPRIGDSPANCRFYLTYLWSDNSIRVNISTSSLNKWVRSDDHSGFTIHGKGFQYIMGFNPDLYDIFENGIILHPDAKAYFRGGYERFAVMELSNVYPNALADKSRIIVRYFPDSGWIYYPISYLDFNIARYQPPTLDEALMVISKVFSGKQLGFARFQVQARVRKFYNPSKKHQPANKPSIWSGNRLYHRRIYRVRRVFKSRTHGPSVSEWKYYCVKSMRDSKVCSIQEL